MPVAAPGVWTAFPALSTLTQNVLLWQEIAVRKLVPSMFTGPVQAAPLYPKMSPVSSTAAQKLALGHDTETKNVPELTTAGVDQVLPLYVMACPFPSTATQNVGDAHDTELTPLSRASMTTGALQLVPLYVTASPPLATAAQNVELVQETLAERIPHAELAIFENSSHMAFVEERQRYIGVVEDFLTRTEALSDPGSRCWQRVRSDRPARNAGPGGSR